MWMGLSIPETLKRFGCHSPMWTRPSLPKTLKVLCLSAMWTGPSIPKKPKNLSLSQRNVNGTQHARNPKILSRLFPGALKKKSSQKVPQRSRVFWQSRSRARDRAPRTHVTTVERSQTDRQTDRARGSQSRISTSTPPPPILYLLLASVKRKLLSSCSFFLKKPLLSSYAPQQEGFAIHFWGKKGSFFPLQSQVSTTLFFSICRNRR
jgi:hypothetical protein